MLKTNVTANFGAKHARPEVRAFEWGSEVGSLPVPFDYILISDCINPVYGEESWQQLATSIEMLSSPETVTFMSTQMRGGEAIESFLQFSAGFLKSDLVYEASSEYTGQGAVRVYRLQLGGGDRAPHPR